MAQVTPLRLSHIATFVVPRTNTRLGDWAFNSCWTTVVEQPSVQPATVRPYPSSVPPGVKDVFVWLTETPAPDFCF